MEIRIDAKDLAMGFLGKKEDYVSKYGIAPGVDMCCAGRRAYDAAQTGVTYYVSALQSFLVIFDSDFDGCCVCQKTYWFGWTNKLYDMLKTQAVPNKSYPGADGFFIEDPKLGFVFIEKQVLEGRLCLMASLEALLYC